MFKKLFKGIGKAAKGVVKGVTTIAKKALPIAAGLVPGVGGVVAGLLANGQQAQAGQEAAPAAPAPEGSGPLMIAPGYGGGFQQAPAPSSGGIGGIFKNKVVLFGGIGLLVAIIVVIIIIVAKKK